ncbi:MAG: hypothetical protein OEY67_00955 [Gammaproteobacteria bacterium]|nr:hypothetical protein [Gammaproteobacteria bacterium]
MTERYTGKPFLRLLELYVLDAIGQLSDKDEETLIKMTPNLQATYKSQGSWKEIIRKVMDLPENMPSLIIDMWNKNQKIAKDNGQVLEGEQFAMMFVDQNLT